MKDLDWQAIKIEYITTDMSISKLAEKYGCPRSQIGKKCKQEAWVAQRRQFVDDVLTETVAHEVKKQSERLIRLMEATGRAIDVAMEALRDDRQFHRYVVTEATGPVTTVLEKQFDKVDTKSLKELVGILKELTALARDFDNVPTPAQAEQRRINDARLKLEERKVASLLGDDSGDSETGVALIPPVIEEQDDD